MKKKIILFLVFLIPALVFAFTYSWKIDYMEYANDAATQTAYATNNTISNGSIDNEDMADISEWADSDTGAGDSSQVTFDSKSTMKLDSGGAAGTAVREQDVGTYATRTVISFSFYHDAIGTIANVDYTDFRAYDGTNVLVIQFASEGLIIKGGEVGTDLIVQDTWQDWTFDINHTATTVNVYLGGVLKASNVDWSGVPTATATGTTKFRQHGNTTNNRITYVDWFKAGVDFGLQSYSEDTIIQQGTYSLKGVAVATDSLNDTLTRTIGDNLDLSNCTGIEYDIYALRTGSNIKIGIHDSGGTTSEHTANVAESNVNQTESWDISGISDANKDDIDSIIITIVNADAANTFYLDDLKAGLDAAAGGSYTFVQ